MPIEIASFRTIERCRLQALAAVLILGACLARPAPATAQVAAEPGGTSAPRLSPDQWRSDLLELVEHVRANHRDPYHTVSEEAFEVAVQELLDRLPGSTPNEVVGAFARLLASVGDGHTRLTIPVNVLNLGFEQGHTPDPAPAPGAPRFHTLPLRFADFDGGVYVTSATAEHARLIGARLVTIGGDPVEEVITRLGPFVAADGDAGRRFHAIKLLAVPEMVELAGASAAPEATAVALRARDGVERTVTLRALAYDDTPSWVEPEAYVTHAPDDPYFSIDADRPDALIVRIRQINDSPTETLGAFSLRLAEAIESHRPERIVLDLRYCHGGDQSLSRAFVLPLVRWEGSTEAGRLFALVGPETFSAAVNLSSRLEEWTQVTFVGEPLGSGPSHYSSSDREELDQSNLVVRVSTGYFVGWTGSEWRSSVEIGLPIKASIDAYLAGEDDVLEAALSYRAPPGYAQKLIDAHTTSGINTALIMWSRYRTDPATADLPHEPAANTFARFLMESGELDYAANIFLFNREFHPRSIDAFLGEAEARYLSGDIEAAAAVLEAARAIAPGDPRIAALAERFRRGPAGE